MTTPTKRSMSSAFGKSPSSSRSQADPRLNHDISFNLSQKSAKYSSPGSEKSSALNDRIEARASNDFTSPGSNSSSMFPHKQKTPSQQAKRQRTYVPDDEPNVMNHTISPSNHYPTYNMSQFSIYPSYEDSCNRKIFNDPIHQSIQLDELTVRIIDTPQFQRLGKLKQLGTSSFVFRGATHTRFEHSIGVSYLSEKFVKHLQDNQPELQLTKADVLCVKIAGLCHDLGHGPFSHLYDGVFLSLMNRKWRHEDGSVNMLRYLLQANHIHLEQYGIDSRDLLFIEEIILGVKESHRKGREWKKFFLYDIVNNTRSGLDMDKIDYFQRDMKYTNVIFNANFERFIQLARVCPSEPIDHDATASMSIADYPWMICYPEKLVREAVDLFRVRFRMHGSVYQHKTVKQVEYMLTDALMLANDYINIKGSKSVKHPDGRYKISECIDDTEALSNLDDSIVDIILADTRPELIPAQDILHRIKNRKLYVHAGKSAYDRNDEVYRQSEDDIRSEIFTIAKDIISSTSSITSGDAHIPFSNMYDEDTIDGYEAVAITMDSMPRTYMTLPSIDDIIVEKMHLHYGLKQHNPVARMRFFSKLPSTSSSSTSSNFSHITHTNSHSISSSSQASSQLIGHQIDERVYASELPRVFEEHSIRLFSRSLNKDIIALIRRSFEAWCVQKETHIPFPSLSQQPMIPNSATSTALSQEYPWYNSQYGSP